MHVHSGLSFLASRSDQEILSKGHLKESSSGVRAKPSAFNGVSQNMGPGLGVLTQ